MGEKLEIACARPAAETIIEGSAESQRTEKKEVKMILIGRKAPDFTAPAYHNGDFVNIKLSDYLKPFRLHPPRKGYRNIKLPYPEGALGYRGKEINELLRRMI